ncbi:MAG: hypothetical protein OES46_05070 [Gammaproteobacteria bacterium]|jgi:hypothetical protein|nr:hypothetical protein [Gammaproteobacteria bacterium]
MNTVTDVKCQRFTGESISNIAALALTFWMLFASRHTRLLSTLAQKYMIHENQLGADRGEP